MERKQFIQALKQTKKENFALSLEGFDLVISVGALPSRQDANLLEAMQKSLQSGSKLVYLFTMEDTNLVEKSSFFSRYEVGSEEGVFALLAKSFLNDVSLPESMATYFDEMDDGYISAESNLGEEEIEEIEALYAKASKVLLVIGEDVLKHSHAGNIAQLAGAMARYGKAKLFINGIKEEEIVLDADNLALEEVAEIKSFDGVVVYECPVCEASEEALLIGSAQFQMAAKVQNNDVIDVMINQKAYRRTFKKDEHLKGVIALMPCTKTGDVYPYHVAKIVKADVQ